MTRRSAQVAVVRGAGIALALLLAAACGQKPGVDTDTVAAPSVADQPVADVPVSETDPAAGGGETVDTGAAAGAGAAPGTGASSGGGSSAGTGSASPSGRGKTGSAGTGAAQGRAAGTGSGSGRTQTSAARPASGGGTGTAAPAPVPGSAAAAVDRTGVTDTTIRIGIHAPITGAAPFPQNAFDKGKDVYWKYLAEKGGLFGRNIQIVFRDDQVNPSRAVQVCREMVEQEKVFILMGAAGSEQITACAR